MQVIKHKRLLIFSVFLCVSVFFDVLAKDWGRIASREIAGPDTTVNSVVSANLSRKIFPPMLRLNSLVETGEENDWTSNAYWQHIPPLFAYVPVLPFWLNGGISVDIYRISYALVELLTVIVFILATYLYDKKVIVLIASTMAGAVFLQSKMARGLITGDAFGRSDIFLAFCVVLAGGAIYWYLSYVGGEKRLSSIKLLLIGFLVSLPILAKSFLGGVAPFFFFLIMIVDIYKLRKKKFFSFRVFIPLIAFFLAIEYYCLSLYLSSSATFNAEVFTPFKHFGDYESWGRPWNYFFTNYFPEAYKINTSLLVGVLVFVFCVLFKFRLKSRTLILLALSSLFFVFNLAAISMVSSKAPNFMFQSYLFFLFAGFLAPCVILEKIIIKMGKYLIKGAVFVFAGVFLLTALKTEALITTVEKFRREPPNYGTRDEEYYRQAEYLRSIGLGTGDLLIIKTQGETAFGFTNIFLMGLESRPYGKFLEIAKKYGPKFYSEVIKKKYKNVYFIFDQNDGVLEQWMPYAEISLDLPQSGWRLLKIKSGLSEYIFLNFPH